MRRLLLPLVVLTLLLAACSSDDDASPAATEPGDDATSEVTDRDGASSEVAALEEWIAAADEICAEANEEVDALDEPESLSDVAEVGPDLLQIGREQVAALEALGQPDEMESQIEEILDLLVVRVGLIEELVEAAEEGDGQTANQIADEGEAILEQLQDLAAEVGFEVCGVPEDDGQGGGSSQRTYDTGDPVVDIFAQTTYDSLVAAGFNDEEADCVIEGVLDRFTVEELVEIGEGAPAVQEAIEEVTLDCVDLDRLVEIGSAQ